MELAINAILQCLTRHFQMEFVFYVHQFLRDVKPVSMEVLMLLRLVNLVILDTLVKLNVLLAILHAKVVMIYLALAKMDISQLLQQEIHV